MQAEDIAALYEAVEAIGDDGLVLTLVHALRHPAFRRDVQALLASPDVLRHAAMTVCGCELPRAANG